MHDILSHKYLHLNIHTHIHMHIHIHRYRQRHKHIHIHMYTIDPSLSLSSLGATCGCCCSLRASLYLLPNCILQRAALDSARTSAPACGDWNGFRENLRENPIFHGKIDGFRLSFPFKPIHWVSSCQQNTAKLWINLKTTKTIWKPTADSGRKCLASKVRKENQHVSPVTRVISAMAFQWLRRELETWSFRRQCPR